MVLIPPRRFTLVDAMALLAATAVGLALARTAGVYGTATYTNTFEWFPNLPGFVAEVVTDSAGKAAGPTPLTLAERLELLIDQQSISPPFVVAAGLPCLVCWTATVLLLRLRAPRPRFRRLARQPGFVACFAAGVVLAVRAVGALLSALAWLLPELSAQAVYKTFVEYPPCYRLWSSLLYPFPFAAPGEIGLAVAAAWLILGIGGSWRAERSWVDRAGRALGAVWLIMIPLLYWWVGLRRWAH
jgi:hypothetical protein